MLNRKLSNYIYYGAIALMVIIVFLIRIIAVGSIDRKIAALEAENVTLQTQITSLNEIVQDNSNTQSSQIYDLNANMPSIYNEETLTNKIISKLERLGISESSDYNRSVYVSENTKVSGIAALSAYSDKYAYVEIQVTFATTDIIDINSFLDSMIDDDQIFILNRVSYDLPDDDEDINVSITFIAVYNDEIVE